MEDKIKIIAKELEGYYYQIVSTNESLTTIQKKDYADSLKYLLASKGVHYFLDDIHSSKPYFNFTLRDNIITDVGIITDVTEKGDFPIRLSIGENIVVFYEPRNLLRADGLKRMNLNNSEYKHLTKSSRMNITGRIQSCHLYYRNSKPDYLEFRINAIFPRENIIQRIVKDLFG